MSITIKCYKDYEPPEKARKKFGVLCRNDNGWWYHGDAAKNIKKGEVIKIFTTSRGSLKLPFNSITSRCLYTSKIGDTRGFFAFAVEKNFGDVVFGRGDVSIIVDLRKVTKIRHYKNVFFHEARKQKVHSTLMEYTKLSPDLINLIKTWLPSSCEEEEEITYEKYKYKVPNGLAPPDFFLDFLPTPAPPDGCQEADIDYR